MAEKFDEFMADVEEDIRQQKYQELWSKYGKYVTGIVSTVLLTTAFYNFWEYRSAKKAALFSEQLIEGAGFLSQGDTNRGLSLLKPLIDQGSANYATLSEFAQATSLHVKNSKEDKEQALKIYHKLQKSKEPLFRDLAYVYASYLRLDQNPQAKELEEIRTELGKIQKNAAVYGLAQEALAISYIYEKHYTKALPILTAIVQDAKLPKQLRARAEMMVQHANSRSH